jgi:8-oxo-dGTP diphosphatase
MEQTFNVFNIILMVLLAATYILRKWMPHSELKRLAFFRLSINFMAVYAAVYLLDRYELSMYFMIPFAALMLGALYFQRKHIFIFRYDCAQCGAKLDLPRIFYRSDNLCHTCAETKDRHQSELEPLDHVEKVSDIEWDNIEYSEEAVLCFIRKGDELALIHKLTGLGKGKINAPGGRIDEGEKAVDAAIRETQEEIHLTAINPELVCELQFVFKNGYKLHGFVFLTDQYEGDMQATTEANPFWCKISELPWDRMWEDDRYWLPQVLEGKKTRGRFIFDGDKMLDQSVETVMELSS